MEHFKIGDERFYPSPYGNVPSVTTIQSLLAKPALIPWAAGKAIDRMRPFLEMLKAGMISIAEVDIDKVLADAKKEHKIVKEEAADRGTMMHEYIANYYRMLRNRATRFEAQKNVYPVITGKGDRQIETAWTAFLKWDAVYEPDPIFVEMPVHSHHRYAGTMDFFGKMSGKFYVVDFKSAKAIYDETSMQVAAYATALMETQTDVDIIDGWGCLRLDKETGEPEWREYSGDEILSAIGRFIKLCEYWHLTNDWNQMTKAAKKEAKKNAKRKG